MRWELGISGGEALETKKKQTFVNRNLQSLFFAQFLTSVSVEGPLLGLEIVSLALNTLAGTPAFVSTALRRSACAVTSGCPATWRIRNGGMPLSFNTCVTAEKSRCFLGSLPNLRRCPNSGSGEIQTEAFADPYRVGVIV